MKVLATFNIKGGVGKTSSAVNLSYEASRSGIRVLLWDLDPQGAATFLCRVRPKVKGGVKHLVGPKGELEPHLRATDFPSLDVLPADLSLRYLDLSLDAAKQPARRLDTLLRPLADRYDLVLLDCAPGITHASASVFSACDALLVPVVPSPLSARTLAQLSDHLAEDPDAPRVFAYLSMVERHNKLHGDAAEYLRAEWPGLLSATIERATLIERMGLERGPVGAFAPGTSPAVGFRRLWAEVGALLWP